MIRNIIFDYGGVIIDIDYDNPRRELEKIGVNNFDAIFSKLKQHPMFDLLDKGKITEHDFREEFRKLTEVSLTDEQIDHAWNSMLLGIKEEKIKLLKQLHLTYKTFLLSNTNFIHIRWITKYLLRQHGRVNLDSLFDKVYYSCVVGMRKPDAAIFLKVIEANSLKPQETLYIDDSLHNVEAANNAGLHGLLYDPASSLTDFIHENLEKLSAKTTG